MDVLGVNTSSNNIPVVQIQGGISLREKEITDLAKKTIDTRKQKTELTENIMSLRNIAINSTLNEDTFSTILKKANFKEGDTKYILTEVFHSENPVFNSKDPIEASIVNKPLLSVSTDVFRDKLFYHDGINENESKNRLKDMPPGTWLLFSENSKNSFAIRTNEGVIILTMEMADYRKCEGKNNNLKYVFTLLNEKAGFKDSGLEIKFENRLSEEQYLKIQRASEFKTFLEKSTERINPVLQKYNQKLSDSNYVNRFTALEECTKELLKEAKMESRRYLKYHFGNIPCPQATSVKVDKDTLNANFVHLFDQEFICGQYPHPEAKGLLWKSILEYTDFILDLTSSIDMDKQKFKPYYPQQVSEKLSVPIDDAAQRISSGSGDESEREPLSEADLFTIEYVAEEPLGENKDNPDAILSTYIITDPRTNPPIKKTVKRINFTKWIDHSVVSLEEIKEIAKWIDKYKTNTPPLVHCSAGVGRTGTVCAATGLINAIKEGRVTRDNYLQVIHESILKGRFQRGPAFVQTEEQYNLLVKTVENELTLLEQKQSL